MAISQRYKVLDHTADFSFQVTGKDLEDLIRCAILSTIDIMFGLRGLRGDREYQFDIPLDDPEMAIFSALSEVIFMIDAASLIPYSVELIRQGDKAKVICICDRFDPNRHKVKVAFKAPTLHGLKIKKEGDRLYAKLIIDT